MSTKKEVNKEVRGAFDYVVTPIVSTIHFRRDNPLYGESVIRVEIEDEAGGGFIRLRSLQENMEPGEIQIDMEQLEIVVNTARDMLKNYNEVAVKRYVGNDSGENGVAGAAPVWAAATGDRDEAHVANMVICVKEQTWVADENEKVSGGRNTSAGTTGSQEDRA